MNDDLLRRVYHAKARNLYSKESHFTQTSSKAARGRARALLRLRETERSICLNFARSAFRVRCGLASLCDTKLAPKLGSCDSNAYARELAARAPTLLHASRHLHHDRGNTASKAAFRLRYKTGSVARYNFRGGKKLRTHPASVGFLSQPLSSRSQLRKQRNDALGFHTTLAP
jgi:hypothetical protein